MSTRQHTGKVRAVVYDRVSESDPESQAEHLRRCRDFCKARGWQVVAEHADTASGFSRSARRPGWDAVTAAVEAGEVDAVVVFAVSRAGRNLARFAAFVEACKDHGVTFASATEPIDTSGPMGEVVLALLSALAQVESATKRERALVGRSVAAKNGTWTGGRRPFGWQVEGGRLVLDETEARMVRDAATALLNGDSVAAITRRWNAAEIETTGGNAWKRDTVKRVLTRETNAPDILTPSDLDRVTRLLDGRRTGRKPERYALTGVLTCAEHGAHLRGGGDRYACFNGGEHGDTIHLSVSRLAVENVVLAAVREHEVEHPAQPVEARDPSDDLVREREHIVAALEALGESDLSEHVLRGRERRLVRDLEAVEARLDAVKPATRPGFFEGYVPDDVYVRQHVERVEVGPSPSGSKRFDPARLRIVWSS